MRERALINRPRRDDAAPACAVTGGGVSCRCWTRHLLLLMLSVLFLSLALAPVYQFYFAWVGLVPWLVMVSRARSHRAAFFWSWLGGTLFFSANMWWLAKVTVPGMFGLMIYLGLFFGFAAVILRICRLIPIASTDASTTTAGARPALSVLLMSSAWVALEYVRGNWSMFGDQGLPWLYLGTTQTPLLAMCQVADFGGVYAVSFWVMLLNALGFFAFMRRRQLRAVIPAMVLVGFIFIAILAYGIFRMEENTTLPGLTVMVVQSNYKQSNTGEKGAPREEIVRFHLKTTRDALADCDRRGLKVDLVAWSETMMPPINLSTRQFFNAIGATLFQSTHDEISNLAGEHHVALIVGGEYGEGWHERDGYGVPSDRRNSAYLFERSGLMSEQRYDKIHLVPFGEFIPFGSIPPLYKLLVSLGPQYYEDYILTPGADDALTAFELDPPADDSEAAVAQPTQAYRFVVPICFEDIVGPLVARMFRGTDGIKRADFLVNLTNDGWFMANQMPQHLQAAVFRSIENRVPTARSVNTGVSGFIDSLGRVHDTVPADTEGWNVATLQLDSRVTFYTKHGDALAILCSAATIAMIGNRIVRRRPEGTATKQD